ncbi:DUF1444 domain-containing protein [Calidifontibacillus erzurumensis]|uniref:UPF0354 protein HR057_06025 n=1 Tax=Calidifontibacillus erzurumensis TaxID=2741433 RepID=A0A8J8GGF3_9BACI|nr:DUF1444 domain-containing protein [Calidifontibacillus erzurumensis]NSL51328.1 DUF1444 domain-containing protein [Calidifontibacillus erzurumensis]
MTSIKMKNILLGRLQRENWKIEYDHKNEQLRIEDRETKKGMTVALAPLISKWEERKDKAIDEVVYYIEEAMSAMVEKKELAGKEKQIFPVIRSTSFPTETKEGKKLIFDDHTAETRIYYALDLGTSYQLIDSSLVKKEGWSEEQIKEIARFNVRSLPANYKKDEVAGNIFYFINTNDGYDASRILNDSLLEKMASMIEGTMTVATPHQDVLIFGDIRNENGFAILGQMMMHFFTEGRVPITVLPFLYENKQLEPIFVLAQNKQ